VDFIPVLFVVSKLIWHRTRATGRRLRCLITNLVVHIRPADLVGFTNMLPSLHLAGYGSVDAKAGHTLYTEYQQAPRAKIFRRDQGTVTDLASMQHMMR
jgi:hypothetical protein